MFGVATTLYSLLTGNPPDKMGRTAFRWPPQGENLLSAPEKQEWQRIHRIIRRAVDERPAERFGTFDAVAQALNGRTDGPRGSAKKARLLVAGVLVLVLAAGVTVALIRPFRDAPKPPVAPPTAAQKSDPSNPAGLTDKEMADYRATASLAALYFDEKNYQAALEMINQLTTAYPVANTFPYYSTLRAQCLYKLDRPEEAHAELRRGLLGKRLDLASFGERMKLWDALGDLPGAEAEVTRIIEEASPITLHYTARARLRLRQGNFDGAEKDIHAASTLDDDPARAGLAEKLRAGFAQEFPDYARYLTERGLLPKNATQAVPAAPEAAPSTVPEIYRKDLQRLDDALEAARKELAANRALVSVPVDTAIAALKQLSQKPSTSLKEVASRLSDIQKALGKALEKVPPIPQGPAIMKIEAPLKAIAEKIRSIPQTTEEKVNYGWEVEPMVNLKIQRFDEELNYEQGFRAELMQKAGTPLYKIEKKFGSQQAPDESGLDPSSEAIMEMTAAINLRLSDLTKL